MEARMRGTESTADPLTVVYVAPEIPALSATFVYNEILKLEELGLRVVPVSMHVPGNRASDSRVAPLARRTCYLYAEPKWLPVRDSVLLCLSHPFCYARAVALLATDCWRVGVGSHIGRGLVYRFLMAARVARLVRRKGCSHVHAHFAHVSTDIGMYAAALCRSGFSFTAHANDLFENCWLLKEKVRRSRFVVTISAFNRDLMAAQGAEPSKVHVVRCGVERRGARNRRAAKRAEGPVVGSLGRMVAKKGFADLLRAWAPVVQRHDGVRLEVAGDGPLRAELEKLAASLGVSDTVRFLGAMPNDQVLQWMAGLDVFALACCRDSSGDMDGVPVVLMEAMLSGTIVVSTRLSGIPELVADEVTGYLAEPGDVSSLADKLAMALSLSEDGKKRMRRRARAKVHGEFDSRRSAEKLADLFRSFVHTP